MASLAQITTEHVIFGYSNSTQSSKEYALHCHNFYEIYYYIEGDVDYLVEGIYYKLSPHSLLLLAPNVFHGVRVNTGKPYIRIALHFYPEALSLERRAMLLPVFPGTSKADTREIFYVDHVKEKIFPQMEALIDCACLSDSLKSALLPVYLEALLSRIMTLSKENGEVLRKIDGSDSIHEVINYLNKHYTDRITLDLIADKFCISKHHLNKVFRKATGTTLCDYLSYKRIIYAKQLLMGGHSAEEAARNSGFTDYSAFYRAYLKIIGNSPIKDRGVLPSLIR